MATNRANAARFAEVVESCLGTEAGPAHGTSEVEALRAQVEALSDIADRQQRIISGLTSSTPTTTPAESFARIVDGML